MLFPSGDLATRECLLQFRAIASEQVRNNLGVALTHDDHNVPITVVTRKIPLSSSMWVTTGDVKIRFSSTEVARAVYYQQREQSRGKNSGLGYLEDIIDKRCAIIIPDGVSKEDTDNAMMCMANLACPDF